MRHVVREKYGEVWTEIVDLSKEDYEEMRQKLNSIMPLNIPIEGKEKMVPDEHEETYGEMAQNALEAAWDLIQEDEDGNAWDALGFARTSALVSIALSLERMTNLRERDD